MRRKFLIFSLGLLTHGPVFGEDMAPLSAEDQSAESLGTLYARQDFVTRTDPDPEGTVRAKVPRGLAVQVLSESEDRIWYWVEIEGGIRAWAQKDYLVPLKPEEPPGIEQVFSEKELRQFHHVLAIDKFYTFNLEIVGGPSTVKGIASNDPKAFGSLAFGPGIGSKLGPLNRRRNFLVEARALVLYENFYAEATDVFSNRSLRSFGTMLNLRYLWVHDRSTAGGLFTGLGFFFPLNADEEFLEKPGFAAFRAGLSVSFPVFDEGALVMDLGGVLRSGATGGIFSTTLLF